MQIISTPYLRKAEGVFFDARGVDSASSIFFLLHYEQEIV